MDTYPLAREAPVSLEEYEALPPPAEGGWIELARGRLVREPGPGARHGGVQAELGRRLQGFLREPRSARVFYTTGFRLASDPPTVRIPDIAVVSAARLPDPLPEGMLPFGPDLAIEIVSPFDTVSALQEKVEDYLAAGAAAVWIVDPRARTVTVHRSPTEIVVLAGRDVLDGAPVLPGFRLALPELFA